MKDAYITITGLNHYLGSKPFKVGRVVRIMKEEENEFDTEAIRVELPYIGTIGYVANSAHTVYEGTASAGRLYDKIGDRAFAQVMFITHTGVIARVLRDDEVNGALQSESDFFSTKSFKPEAKHEPMPIPSFEEEEIKF